jgi:hypothetical protein
MSFASEDGEADRHKAKHLAMQHALQMIQRTENQLCSTCAEWKSKCIKDSRDYCQEIEKLRKAVQKMIDTLGGYVSESSLHGLMDLLQLDSRVFIVHSSKCYTSPDGTSDKADMRAELDALQQQFEQVTSERDLAKMQLYKLSKDLSEQKEANQELEKQLTECEKEAQQRQRRLEKVEVRAQTLETQSSCAGLLVDPTRLQSPSLKDMEARMPQQSSRHMSPSHRPPQPETEPTVSQKMRRKIDAEHPNGRSCKSSGRARESVASSRLGQDAEHQRLDALEERLGLLENNGFVGRAPLPEVLASRPCKPPIRMRAPKELELNLKEATFSKGHRSRSKGSYLDGVMARPPSPGACSSMIADFDRGIMATGQSSQTILFSDHELRQAEVGAYLSRQQFYEQRPPSRAGM